MQFAVSARPKLAELHLFWTSLNDGTIRSQEPDGKEIVSSMQRAVIDGATVKWYETCYCNPPLKHERSTVYDKFFTDFMIESVSNPPKLEGEPFWDYMRESSNVENDGGPIAQAGLKFRYLPIRIL